MPPSTPTPPATNAPSAPAPTGAPAAPNATEPISSGEATPWTGDPGFPRAENWMLVDPRWMRKWIPKPTHLVLLVLWALFMVYLLWLKFFHTPPPSSYVAPPPANVELTQPAGAPGAPGPHPPSSNNLAPAAPPEPATVPKP